ncbi:MAG: hypothetical protein ACYDCD_02910 [Candidatus Acidiferrales bacterium]
MMGVATRNGRKTVDGIVVNAQLISVDGVAVTTATMGKVLIALHGRPRETRELKLERHEKEFTVNARVTSF